MGPKAGKDLLGRLTGFLEVTDPVIVFLGLSAILVLVVLALMGRRFELYFMLFLAATFSGAIWPSVDAGSTLLRWVLIGLLAANCLRLTVYPGTPILLFLGYVIIGMALIPRSTVPQTSIQAAALTLGSILCGISIGGALHTRKDFTKLFVLTLLTSVPLVVLGLIYLPTLASSSYGRFSAHLDEATKFVQMGGMYLPMALWGALQPWRRIWRVGCGILFVSLLLLLIASAQRTGTFAGIIACLPLLARRQFGGVLIVSMLVALVGFGAMRLATFNQRQAEFIVQRFSSLSTTNRTEIWREVFRECAKDPIVGHGLASDIYLAGGHRAHNMYLTMWYTTGVPGLMFAVSAILVALLKAFYVMTRGPDPWFRDMGRLLFGLTLGYVAASMFTTFTSPANFVTLMWVVLLVTVARLADFARKGSSEHDPQTTGTWAYQYVLIPRSALAGMQSPR